jgi:serine/threonine-protein kinase
MKPGDILDGRYTITDRLGAGGMGEVYKATHTLLGSSRVIKVVHPHISGNTDARDRFLREARAATKVQHPNVATLHDFAALPDGAHYMVWEFIDGTNVAQRLRTRSTLPPKQAVRIAIQALRGLEAIHRAGIVHRDISPENLMITADDEVKIIDLGVAKLEEGADAVSQTRTGIFVGKLRYAAPEQLGFMPEGEKVDARADLYSMAMVLVELLTGRPPYEAKSPHEYFMLHAAEPRKQTVSLPADLAGSAALQAVLEKALARDRNQRYATAREFATALEEIERTLPEPRDMPTMALPLDGDETMRTIPAVTSEDTLHRETIRSQSGEAQTVRTPLPAAVTVQTPLPAALPHEAPAAPAPPPKMVPGMNPAYVVLFMALIALAIAAALLWPREKRRDAIIQLPETTTTAAVTVAPPQVAEASVTVTDATTTVAPVTVTTATVAPPPPATTTTVAPVRPRPVPAPRGEPETPAETADDDEEEAPAPTPMRAVATYVDGGDDSDANERALATLRREVRGTTTVALRGGAMTVQLGRALREHFPGIQFADHADVVIRFNGRIDRLGAGRKRRAGTATVEKNGRVIFRYEMPDEIYRVGQTPPEAFANVIAEALQE